MTGARAPVALELARLFHAAGHRVLAAESLPRHLCERSRAVARSFRVPAPNPDRAAFRAALRRIVESEGVDLVLPTCEEVFHLAGLDAPVFCPPPEPLLRLHSKLAFIRTLEARGVPAPETWDLATRPDLPRGVPLVFKPVWSRFAVDVRFGFAADAPPPDRHWIAQRLVQGRPLCAYAVTRNGRLTAFAAYDAAFTAGRGAAVSFRTLDHPRLHAWVRDFAAAEGVTGQLSFDFLESADGVLWPLECNPRATSGVHLFTAGDRLDRAFLEHPDCLRPQAGASAVVGVAMLFDALPRVRTLARLREWLARMRGARDAVLRWDDPLPFLSGLGLLAHLAGIALRRRTSLLAASTLDIEWNGPS